MKYAIGLIILISLAACSEKKTESQDAQPQGVLTESQKKALQDAKAVDDKLLQADEERRKQLEEATQ